MVPSLFDSRALSFLRPREARPLLDDQAATDAAMRRTRRTLLVALTLVYGLFYTCRIGLSVIKKDVIDAGIYDAAQLGQISGVLFGAYAFGKLLNGAIADRVNVARFIPLGLLISALANLAFGMTTTFALACLAWLVNGYFQGVGASASVVSLNHWFTARERGRVYGIWSAAHSIGEAVNFVFTARLVAAFGWRAAFIGPGLWCIAVAVVALFVLRDRPRSYGLPTGNEWKGEASVDTATHAQDVDERAATRAAQKQVLRMPAVWIVAVASGLMYVTRYGVMNWGVLYLQEQHKLSLVDAADLIALTTGAGLIGSIAYGFISDTLFQARRPPVTLIFGLLEVAALALIFYGPSSQLSLAIGFIVYGFTLSGLMAVLGGLFAVDITSPRATGMAMGLVGFISYGGTVLQDLVAGAMVRAHTTLMDGVKHVDFSGPALLWVSSSVVSMLLAASLWRVQPRAARA